MKFINKRLIITLLSLPCVVFAQDGHDTYAFLRFPASARANALGGHSVSLVERDPSLIFHNPALLGGELSGMMNLSFMNYMADVKVGSAVYTHVAGSRGAWGAGATYINYGSMKETTPENVVLGTFSAQDINLQAFYAYDLSDKWRGGLSLKGLYSTLADYSSFGLAVDAGLSYFDAESDMSFGFALKNIGAQLKSYYDERQRVPWDIQIGLSKRLSHAPLRVSVTAMYLNRWKFDYTDNLKDEEDGFVETAFKHLVFGLEFLPSDNFWIGAGLNPKTMMDMKLTSGNSFGGFSAGAGIKVSRFNVGVSVARYHPSAMSLMVGVAVLLSDNAL
ncbi:MAG: type IX secretion system protein PorQ [Tannerella sp.]|jgi:hypothetical protein|nr:type IX secretion system protein PorQ [Tannerella sp.]